MPDTFGSRLRHAWNAFFNKDPTQQVRYVDFGNGYGIRPDRPRLTRGSERTIATAVLNRIALDAASLTIKHVRTDKDGRYLEDIDSSFNSCLTLEANKDQTSRAFFQDVFLSLLDEGSIAIVPVDTSIDPSISGSYEINTLRVGRIIQWYPDFVKVNLYNDRIGRKEDLVLPKASTAIVENPLFPVLNEPNSTLQRLIRKLALLDFMDEQNSSGKLDIIIQLPYTTHSPVRKQQAENRRKEVEDQLVGSKYGIAYIDGTEHITQLNRPAENNLMSQVEYLTSMLYSQLGITTEIMNGTADEKAMTNYFDRSIEPIVSAVCDEMKRKFLTKTARSQHQTIKFFRDPFRLIPTSQMAEIVDKFTRNEITTSNEMRQALGMIPSKDPTADELRNKNLSKPKEDSGPVPATKSVDVSSLLEEIQNDKG